jgi:hypothetical protein
MNAALEITGTFSETSRIFAPDRASRFIATPASRRGDKPVSVPSRRQETVCAAATEVAVAVVNDAEASRRRTDARLEAVGFSLALLFVISLCMLGAWATVLLVKSSIQAQSLPGSQSFMSPSPSMAQNGYSFQR